MALTQQLMAHNTPSRAAATYAKLLRLYPKAYRQRFAEPMQQMFIDMYNERVQLQLDTRGLVCKVYAETLAGIVKENIQEAVMTIKTTKTKLIIGAVLVAAGSLVAVVLINNRPTAQTIHPGSMLKQVRDLSKGKKNPCLPNVQNAVNAVHQDDVVTEYKGNKMSNFEESASNAIADVPAGTNYDITINDYANGYAKGTMTYQKDYGTYNYLIHKLPAHGQWQLVSVTACKK